jgi:hypothetical protein
MSSLVEFKVWKTFDEQLNNLDGELEVQQMFSPRSVDQTYSDRSFGLSESKWSIAPSDFSHIVRGIGSKRSWNSSTSGDIERELEEMLPIEVRDVASSRVRGELTIST